jgi:hypothetical protein
MQMLCCWERAGPIRGYFCRIDDLFAWAVAFVVGVAQAPSHADALLLRACRPHPQMLCRVDGLRAWADVAVRV